MRKIDLEASGYALVLLDEICQGYDTELYIYRCTQFLREGLGSLLHPVILSKWLMGDLPTNALLRKVEELIEHNS